MSLYTGLDKLSTSGNSDCNKSIPIGFYNEHPKIVTPSVELEPSFLAVIVDLDIEVHRVAEVYLDI